MISARHDRTVKTNLLPAFLIFLGITFLYLFPILKDPRHAIPDTGDSFHNIWIMGTNCSKFLRHNLKLSTANIYYPDNQDTFDFSEKQFIQSSIFLPFYLIKEPILGYNFQLILSFLSSSIICYFIFLRISNNHRLSILGSIVANYYPFKFLHLPHLQLLSAQWIYLPILYLVSINGKLDSTKKILILWILATPQLISWGYLTIYLYIIMFIILSFSVIFSKNKMVLLKYSTIYFLITILSCLYFYLPYINQLNRGYFRPKYEFDIYGVDLVQWITPASNSFLYSNSFLKFSHLSPSYVISGLFSGFTIIIISFLAFARLTFKNKRITLKIIFNLRSKWYLIFIFLLSSITLLICGNNIKLAGITLTKNYLFAISDLLLFGKSMRYLPSYTIPMFFCIGGLISLSKNKLLNRCWLIVMILLILEFQPIITPTKFDFSANYSDAYKWLQSNNNIQTILEYPIQKSFSSNDPYYRLQFQYMLMSTYHNKDMVNGLTGFFPDFYRETISLLVNFPDTASLNRLKKINVTYVLVHNNKLLSTDKDRIQEWDQKPIVTFSDNSGLYQLN